MSKSLRARNAAKRSLQARTSQKFTPRPPKRGSPVTQAKAAADANALINVPNGVRIVGLSESLAAKLFGKGNEEEADRKPTIALLESEQALLRSLMLQLRPTEDTQDG